MGYLQKRPVGSARNSRRHISAGLTAEQPAKEQIGLPGCPDIQVNLECILIGEEQIVQLG
ncbi:hypothetical protein D3C80_1839750 [compost metagenome]